MASEAESAAVIAKKERMKPSSDTSLNAGRAALCGYQKGILVRAQWTRSAQTRTERSEAGYAQTVTFFTFSVFPMSSYFLC
eukprot:2969644-Pleurochrysis_carterae.AAC.12